MRKKNTRLITVISFLLIAGFMATSLTSYYVSRKSLRSEISVSELPLTSDNIYSEIQRDILRPVFISSLMSNDTFLRDWVINGENDATNITKYLKEIKTKYNTFTSFFVSDKTKNYYYGEGILKQVSQKEERDVWYFRVRDMKQEYEINVDRDLANKDEMTIFVNYRVYDYNGNYIGATGVGLTVKAVKDLIEKYQEKYDRNIFFVDKNGDIRLSSSKFPKNLKNVSQLEHHKNFKNVIGSRTEAYYIYENADGETIHANVRFIHEFGWYLIVEQSEHEMTRQIYNTLIINLAVCALITVVVLSLVALSVNAYQKRIETLRGIVPICSFCKKIRDDKGYWNQVEAYVAKYTDAEFSHGVCPDCMKKHYSEIIKDDKKN